MATRPSVIPIAALCMLCASAGAGERDREVLGWVEHTTIEAMDARVKAKLDTGALTSSMQAEDIDEFERDDEDWVRFTVEVEDEASDEVVSETFEKPVYRHLRLHGAGGDDHRKVVLMKVCIGKTVYEEQFSLEDRDNMNYPVLLGRRTIQRLGTVDVTRTFIHNSDCNEDSPVMEHDDRETDEDIGV